MPIMAHTRPIAREAPAATVRESPARIPSTRRAPSCIGTVRAGVLGSWSVTYSTRASIVNRPNAHFEPMKASAEPSRCIQPKWAAQATAATPVNVRSPETRPIRKTASKARPMLVPPMLMEIRIEPRTDEQMDDSYVRPNDSIKSSGSGKEHADGVKTLQKLVKL